MTCHNYINHSQFLTFADDTDDTCCFLQISTLSDHSIIAVSTY